MSFGKLISAGIAFAACALFGIVRNARNAKRFDDLHAIRTDLSSIAESVRLDKLPLDGIVTKLSRDGYLCPIWDEVSRKMKDGKSFSEAFRSASLPEICPEAKKILEAVAEESSAVGSSSFEKRLAEAVSKLGLVEESEKNEMKKKEKTVRYLSLLAGLAAALMLI